MNPPALLVEDLAVSDRSGARLVGPLSLQVAKGGILTIVGESGSGKSLLAQALLGLLPANLTACGAIRYAGDTPIALDDTAALRARWARTVTLLPQEPGVALDPSMRIDGQLTEIGGATPGRIAGALDGVDLPRDTLHLYPGMLSGGMAQRVLFAATALSRADVVIADEPTKGLDDRRTGAVADALLAMAGRGQALAVITHDLALARRLDSECLILNEGRPVEAGPARTILSEPRHPFTRSLVAADPTHWPARGNGKGASTEAVSARGLTIGFAGRPPLIRDVSVSVEAGRTLAVVGPSGCGKTTLGNALLGLHPPRAGSVRWQAFDPYAGPSMPRRIRQRHQKLHQDPGRSFVPHATIGDQFKALGRLMAMRIEERVGTMMERLRLQPALLARRPQEISGGEAQRLAMIRILLLQPDFLVADEPTSRLDLIGQKSLLRLLSDVTEEFRIGMVLITHSATIARSMAHDVLDLAPQVHQGKHGFKDAPGAFGDSRPA